MYSIINGYRHTLSSSPSWCLVCVGTHIQIKGGAVAEISTLSTDFNFMGTPTGVGTPPSPPKPQKPYLPQEIDYIAELIRNGGLCSRAARAVGYTPSQASRAATWIRHLRDESTKPYLWDLYQRELAVSRARLSVTTEQILDEYSCAAFVDPISIQDDNGRVLALSDMDYRTRRAISKIKYIYDNEAKVIGCDVTMIDKKGALDSLAKIMGMLKDKVEHTHTFAGLLDDLSAGNEPLVLSEDQYQEVYEALDG